MSAWTATRGRRPVTVPGFDDPAADCPEKGPAGTFCCTRDAGHPGRHLAGTGRGKVIAAWPGEHTPTEADLTDQAQPDERIHLGDGAYARHDGYYLWVEAERGGGVMHEVALEPEALVALVRCAVRQAPDLAEHLARAAGGE